MEQKVQEGNRLLNSASRWLLEGNFDAALNYSGMAATLLVSLQRSQLLPEDRVRVKALVDQTIDVCRSAREHISKQRDLGRTELNVAAAGSNVPLCPECCDLYKRIANKYYDACVRKDGTQTKELLQSVINANIVEIELKMRLLTTIKDPPTVAQMKKECSDLMYL